MSAPRGTLPHPAPTAQGAGVGYASFSTPSAEAVSSWIEANIRVAEGALSGEGMRVWPWQRRFIRGAFGPGTSTAALTVARGQGKSTLAAAIAAASIAGPLRSPRSLCLVVGASFRGARIIFRHVLAMLADELADRDTWRVLDSTTALSIEHRPTGAMLEALGSDPRRAHGFAPSLAILDEPSQWQPNASARMYSAIRTARGKQPDARILAIGTAPAAESGESWWSRLLEKGSSGSTYVQKHAARADESPWTLVAARRANPSMRYLPDLKAAIISERDEARQESGLEPAYRSLRLNLGCLDSAIDNVVFDLDTWTRLCERVAATAGPYVLGIDTGGGRSMDAAAGFWWGTGALRVFGAFGTVPNLDARAKKDRAGPAYRDMQSRGELELIGDRVVPVSDLLRRAVERWGRPVAVCCDRFKQLETADAMASVMPTTPLIYRGNGFRDGGEDLRRFRRAGLDGRIAAPESLLLRTALACARTLTDTAGNTKLSKTGSVRRRESRDDALCAAVMAVSEGDRRASTPARKPVRMLGVVR